MRSIMKSKYSVPAYVASALLGAVALMAFYESPISPLPVPALPGPPVGRFPPEMPNLPVGTQVPFRGGNQQGGGQYGQSYNQRSLNQQMPTSGSQNYLAQQVLFPGNNVAQQRQMNVANGPVQQLASNLLSSVGGKQQIAQRKSSPDYDLSSRSFFGSTLPVASAKQGMISSPPSVSGQPKQGGNSFLSYFGFGGGQSNSVPTESSNNNMQSAQGAMQMNGNSNLNLQNQANMALASGSSVEPKGANQAGTLSNSHLVNKVKSLFSRSPSHSSGIGSSHSSAISSASGNPYEPYQRMSLVQALMKDTAFIPGFLTPTRKSSTNSGSSSQSSGAANKLQSTLTHALSGSPNPSSRMQVESGPSSLHLPTALKQTNNKQSSGSDSSGYGLYRVAHALLETLTSSVGHARQANSHGSGSQLSESVARKSSSNDDSSSPSLAAATSLIGDIMSSYNTVNNGEQQSQQQQQQLYEKSASQSQTQSSPSSPSSSSSQPSASPSSSSSSSSQSSNQLQSNDQISVRSGEIAVSNNDHEHDQQNAKSQSVASSVAQASSNSNNNKQSQASPSSASSQDAHVRKTRSIGFEYPIESNQELAKREQQPSKASQINNVIDFVADSYSQNRILFNFVMNQVGLSQAVPYVEQILAPGANEHH